MKGKTIGSFLRVLALVALAGALAPRVATAQQGECGKFTLPTEVHWGAAVLPAGVYSFSVDPHNPSTQMNVYRESDPRGGYMFIVQAQETIPFSSQQDRLVLEQKDGESYVTALELGSAGVVLHFSAPKSLR